MIDWGHARRFRGWVDLQHQGVPNDYARYVGPTEEHRFVWLSVALAGSSDQHTAPGLYEESFGIVKRKNSGKYAISSKHVCVGTRMKPRQILPDIDKLGIDDYFRGWVDVQNQGVSNDYAYYVAPTDDIPYPWMTVALAGSTEQRTQLGSYKEKYGVVRGK